jgi:hypothetical protein
MLMLYERERPNALTPGWSVVSNCYGFVYADITNKVAVKDILLRVLKLDKRLSCGMVNRCTNIGICNDWNDYN